NTLRAPMPAPRPAAAAAAAAPAAAMMGRRVPAMAPPGAPTGAAPPPPAASIPPSMEMVEWMEMEMDDERTAVSSFGRDKLESPFAVDALQQGGVGDPILDVLGRQAASGLWEEPGKDALLVTASALVTLLRLGVTGAHSVYGA